jgi:hypothetical protein
MRERKLIARKIRIIAVRLTFPEILPLPACVPELPVKLIPEPASTKLLPPKGACPVVKPN